MLGQPSRAIELDSSGSMCFIEKHIHGQIGSHVADAGGDASEIGTKWADVENCDRERSADNSSSWFMAKGGSFGPQGPGAGPPGPWGRAGPSRQ